MKIIIHINIKMNSRSDLKFDSADGPSYEKISKIFLLKIKK